jgi:uncharacterized protein
MRKRLLPLLILSLLPVPALAEPPTCPFHELRVLAPDGTERVRYRVQVADEPAERERGLMFVEALPQEEGMLFLFDAPSEVGFWMRDTLIPLDLLFIEPDGRIAHIHRDAVPQDETPIWSGVPVTGVLEVNAGEAERHGILLGDIAGSPFFPDGCALLSAPPLADPG